MPRPDSNTQRKPSPLLRLLALLAAAAATAADAQTPSGARRVTLTQTVEPSFRIEPVVHRFRARRGEVIPFEFLIGSLGKDLEVSVTPVNLRQEETGIILHNGQGEASTAMRITSPRRFELGPGRQALIAGEVRVPVAKSNYLSYGILVREAGTAPDFEEDAEGSTRAGVRFVTQYVLRVDVETGIADVGSMKDLRLERGTLFAERGLPRVRGYLRNPTDYAFECFVSAEFAGGKKRPRPIRLGMPSRATLDDDQRYLIRIMPNSTLRLEAPVEQLLTPGEQPLRLAISSGRREVASADFAIRVREEDFPALAQERVVLAEGVAVTPATVELGTTRSTNRSAALRFQNKSSEAARVTLVPLSLDGEPLQGVRFSPAEFLLKAGRTKGVRATLRGSQPEAVLSGTAVVRWTRDSGESSETRLPLSVFGSEPGPPRLELGSIAWDESAGGAFVVQVTNRSEAYTPVDADLSVASNRGGGLRLHDGYGRWLAPGEQTTLAFRPESTPPAGDYRLLLEVRTREGFPPVVRELNATLSGPAATASTKTAGNNQEPS